MNNSAELNRNVNNSELKQFAIKELDDPLRSLILAEKDELDAIDFIAKAQTWLRLLRMQTRK